ncbi:MAG: hypothetical protein ACRC4W_07980 [Treponemataceae bacterium]
MKTLTSVTMGKNIKTIGGNALNAYGFMENLTLNEGLDSVGGEWGFNQVNIKSYKPCIFLKILVDCLYVICTIFITLTCLW